MLPSPASSTNSSPPGPSPVPRRPLRPDFSPVIYLDQPPPSDLLCAASDFGFFHLARHGVPSALAESQSFLRSDWLPVNNLLSLGFHPEDLDHDDQDRILMLDTGGRVDGDGFASLPTLLEFGKCLEKVGLGVVDMLSSMIEGFCKNPFEKRSYTPRCLIWISSYDIDINTDKTGYQMRKSKCYPYVFSMR
ncbi:unnamed protein product [Musa hybrid cultivar]